MAFNTLFTLTLFFHLYFFHIALSNNSLAIIRNLRYPQSFPFIFDSTIIIIEKPIDHITDSISFLNEYSRASNSAAG